ncbi:TetR/AcrR family transcriptional regulator [Bailinhaonella thermotolerans]|uniref:TetR/AcrR family transcriptional regulator n=1 Tax=Bailinhaonella thermotolerans TaxID=1070861 RepID=A0A3A4BH21_9ACTN|nr:TetR/AcrR family transcriptional regulator [Bailinhaonella thermotolerans]RJL34062.1 TetR/AcrR family transcriptional regulator [Bailinhaonella thermotolerans]
MTGGPAGHGGGGTGTPLRRAPVQRRSAERLDRIVDACAGLLEEVGYDGLTTRAVALRAGVPIGSIYRYFRDKRDLVAALAERNLDRYVGRLTARLAAAEPAWGPVIDVVVDEYVAMRRSSAGFAVVDFGSNRALSEHLAALLADRLGADALLAGPEFRRALRIAVEACDAVLRHAFREHPDGDPGVIAETKLLARAYLARFPLS